MDDLETQTLERQVSRFYVQGGKKAMRVKAAFPVAMASFETIQRIVEEKSALCLVFPDEGAFDGVWKFNDEHKNTRPVMVDLFSASAMLNAYKGASDNAKNIIETEAFKNRIKFMRFFDIVMKAMR